MHLSLCEREASDPSGTGALYEQYRDHLEDDNDGVPDSGWSTSRGDPTRPGATATPPGAIDENARLKWGGEANYVHADTIVMVEVDPCIDRRGFIQQMDDSYVYVDSDDVSDPETSDVHPAFLAIRDHLGLTYIDVS